MILNGNQRGGAKDLALHLMKEENEHVEVHEIRGFVAQNIMGALNEAYAISRGTRCKQFMYSLSLNPPQTERVDVDTFKEAIEQAENKLGLEGQPRVIVFHEKEGRRHAHVVWSRIKVDEMKAVQMSFDHDKLTELSRELFREHGWKMPKGLAKKSERDPLNFTLADWQQAKRVGKHPKQIKMAIQDAWAISDSKASFDHALQERGYTLAKGDRGRFVVVDIFGEVYSLRQQTGHRVKEFRARLGDEQALLSVDEIKQRIAGNMLPLLERFKKELNQTEHQQDKQAEQQKKALIEKQRTERKIFVAKLKQRQEQEALKRQQRFRSGLFGFWDRLIGQHKRIQKQNEQDFTQSQERDNKAKDSLIQAQLSQRRLFNERMQVLKEPIHEQHKALNKDVKHYEQMKAVDLSRIRNEVMEKSHRPRRRKRSEREQERPPSGWDLER